MLFLTDENDSWYIDANLLNANITPLPGQSLADLKDDESFKVLGPVTCLPTQGNSNDPYPC